MMATAAAARRVYALSFDFQFVCCMYKVLSLQKNTGTEVIIVQTQLKIQAKMTN